MGGHGKAKVKCKKVADCFLLLLSMSTMISVSPTIIIIHVPSRFFACQFPMAPNSVYDSQSPQPNDKKIAKNVKKGEAL
jgi:hypothetical protein